MAGALRCGFLNVKLALAKLPPIRLTADRMVLRRVPRPAASDKEYTSDQDFRVEAKGLEPSNLLTVDYDP